jgi:hypothetical protein
MPVVGIMIKSVHCEKSAAIVGGIKVNNTTNLRDVRETDLPAIGKTGLAVAFEFKADYVSEKLKKSIAYITIGGDVLLLERKPEELVKVWKRDKKLPDALNIQIINAILRRCLTKALTLSEDLNLPPPIAMPFARQRKAEESRYIG